MATPAAGEAGVCRIAVTGAAGKTGRAVIAALRMRGAHVTAIVHRRPPVGDDLAATTRIVACDLHDAPAMRGALAGASAAYLIAPNLAEDEPAMMTTALAACRDAAVARVVYHSVMHPFAPAMPHHLDKAQVESVLHDSELDWTILQPASYFDNVVGVLDEITCRGVWPVPYPPAATFTSVALADVASAAARVLTEPSAHRYATYELAGPEELSTAQMADIASAILGRTVKATHVPAPPTAGERLRAMFRHYAAAGFRGSPVAITALLSRPPTDWATWLRRTVTP